MAALADNNRDYRVNALRLSENFADDAWYAAVAKTLKVKGDKQVKADILNWFGTKKVASQIDAIVANMNSENTEIAEAAIAAASKIGGETALNALVAQLNGKNAKAATAALLSFNGKVNDQVIAALDADKATQIAALGIASCLHGSHCIFHPVSFIWNLFRKWRIHKHKLRTTSDRSSIPQSTQRKAHRSIPAGGDPCRLQGFADRNELCFNGRIPDLRPSVQRNF